MIKEFDDYDHMNHLGDQTSVLNTSIIAHVDHGKSTIFQCFSKSSKLKINEKFHDSDDVNLFKVSLSCQYTSNNPKNDVFINFIDTPRYLDVSSQFKTSLQMTNRSLVIVDCIEGIFMNTQTVQRQIQIYLEEDKIAPVLLINKMDRFIQELDLSSEEMFQKFHAIIASINDFCKKPIFDPRLGNVAFGSGMLGFGFTLTRFAQIYSKLLGSPVSDLVEKFWGDHYYDYESKTWITSCTSKTGRILKRGFCQFCLEPIQKIFKLIGTKEVDFFHLDKVLKVFDVELPQFDKNKRDNALLKCVMMELCPMQDTIVEMLVQSIHITTHDDQ